MAHKPTVISTFAETLREGCTLHVFCDRCNRAEKFALKAWVAAGHGDEPAINRRWRCSRCGTLGSVRLEPTGAPGWQGTYPGGSAIRS